MSYLNWEVPNSWEWTESLDVCESVRDGTHDTPQYVNEGVPLVTSKNLIDGKISFENVKFISIEDHKEIEKRSAVDAGDVLIAMIGTIGNPVVVDKKFDFSIKNVGLFKKNEEVIYPYYLKYWLDSSSFMNWLKPRLRGTTQKFASLGLLRSLPIPLAPINEQHRIVEKIEELFSELDNGIESLKTAREQLNVYRQALLKHAFEGKLTEQWRKDNADKLETADQLLIRIQQERETRYQQQLEKWNKAVKKWEGDGKEGKKPGKPRAIKLLNKITNDELKKKTDIPDLWSWVKIGDVASVGTGVTPLKSRQDFYNGGTVAWVTSGALNKPYVTEASNYVTDLALVETNLRHYPVHTLLLAMYGEGKTRGKCSELKIPATTNQAIAAIAQQGLEEHTRAYLKWFLHKNYTDIRRESSGGVQPNLNLGIVENTAFPLCSIDEMEAIVCELEQKLSVVNVLDKDINLQLLKSETLRQSILKKAFSGQLVSQDPTDEPASELLKRIVAEKAKIAEQAKSARVTAKETTRKAKSKLK